MNRFTGFACAVVFSFSAMAATAQTRTIEGLVSDSAGSPVAGARVSVRGTVLQSTSDDQGHFRIGAASNGALNLDAKRLGFTPGQKSVDAGGSNDRIRLVLIPLATDLAPVVVSSPRQFSGRLAGYYGRLQRKQTGHFITRDEIDRKSYQNLTQLLRSVPGVNAVRFRGGGGAVRVRGSSCRPVVWLDGVPMLAGEVDLDAFPVSTFHGIEVYPGTASTPPELTTSGGGSPCGTIALWSRGRDTDPPLPRRQKSEDVTNLIETLAVYSSDQVDSAARLLDDIPVVEYPPELLAQGIAGTAMVEFVVDTTGLVEPGSISIVTATHSMFGASVARTALELHYSPALKSGIRVRQAVQQVFRFVQKE